MRATIALIKAMHEEGNVAVCRYASDRSKHIQIVALIPQLDQDSGVYVSSFLFLFCRKIHPF